MEPDRFTRRVQLIPLDQIHTSRHNPRGQVDTSGDSSFDRLVSSIDKVGILVPLVVRPLADRNGVPQFELVDGERRYWASRQLNLDKIPAHVLDSSYKPQRLRRLMFHLHMTREQWGPWEQCMALAEMYPEIEDGIPFDKKDEWEKKIWQDTQTNRRTARDRVHVLAWPRTLKERTQKFIDANPAQDIYSYVLAIEASVVGPSLSAFPDFFSADRQRKINQVRRSLLEKTFRGIETGSITRESIRDVEPLFLSHLGPKEKRTAQSIFESLIEEPNYQIEDARSDISIKLPDILKEKPPKPKRLLSSIRSIIRILEGFDPQFLETNVKGERRREALRKDLRSALKDLSATADRLRDKI